MSKSTRARTTTWRLPGNRFLRWLNRSSCTQALLRSHWSWYRKRPQKSARNTGTPLALRAGLFSGLPRRVLLGNPESIKRAGAARPRSPAPPSPVTTPTSNVSGLPRPFLLLAASIDEVDAGDDEGRADQ